MLFAKTFLLEVTRIAIVDRSSDQFVIIIGNRTHLFKLELQTQNLNQTLKHSNTQSEFVRDSDKETISEHLKAFVQIYIAQINPGASSRTQS